MTHFSLPALLLATPMPKDLLPQPLSRPHEDEPQPDRSDDAHPDDAHPDEAPAGLSDGEELLTALLPQLQAILDLAHNFRSGPVSPAATHHFEAQLQQRLRDLGRQVCSHTFNRIEPDDPDLMPQRLDFQGERYRRRKPSPNTIATLFGPITLRRFLYEDLEPGNPCLFPLEHRLGIVAGCATPALAQHASGWLARHPQKQTRALLQRDHEVCWSAKTLRKVCAAFAAGVQEQRQPTQCEQVLRWLRQAFDSRGRYRPSLVSGRDGIHVPLRREGYREAGTGTLSVYDRQGKRLGTVYLGRMPQPGQGTLSEQLTALITEVLRQWQGPLPRLAYVTDNGYHPAEYYRAVLSGMRHPRTGEKLAWQRVIDYYHAAGYVAQMAEALFGGSKQGKRWERRMRRLLTEKDGVKRLLISATYHQARRHLGARAAEAYSKAYRYLRGNRRWLRYERYRAAGLPIGSGVTEAACKTVFTQRLKQSGMRWEVEGGQVVVDLRVLLLSGVWETAVARWLDSRTYPKTWVQHQTDPNAPEKAA